MPKTRFDQFLLLITTALAAEGTDGITAIAATAALFNPNIQSNINQGEDESVEVKALAYYNYILNDGKKPSWLVTGD